MSLLNARQLHNETSAILNEVSKGRSFQISRKGKIIGTLRPATLPGRPDWKEVMEEVWAGQKKASGKSRNPVLSERERNRR